MVGGQRTLVTKPCSSPDTAGRSPPEIIGQKGAQRGLVTIPIGLQLHPSVHCTVCDVRTA